MPMINRLGCAAAACHGTAGGRGGLKLSLFGGSAEDDYAALVKEAKEKFVKPGRAGESPLVKALVWHPRRQAQLKLDPQGSEMRLLEAWIAQGAKFSDSKAPVLKTIDISPAKFTLAPGAIANFTVTARFADGSTRNVTDEAMCKMGSDRVATVAQPGRIVAKGYGQTPMVMSYLRHGALARVVVPRAKRPDYASFKPFNKIDELVLAKLQELNIEPSGLCSDSEFLRRAHLDVIGVLPTADEARAFLVDADPAKREKAVDRLMLRGEFADRWALKWGDLLRIKSEYPVNLWPNAVQAYHHWVRDAIAKNMPYDQFARTLLTASGSNFRSPPANYFRAVSRKDPQTVAEATALLFMGARMDCARCHVHPTENWTPKDNLAMAAYFAQVQYKPTQEWKEEIVYVNPQQLLREPGGKRNAIVPRMPGGPAAEPYKERDLRVPFVRWLTAPENPFFARCAVNRAWFWLMGRGIVHEPDDMRSTNPPSNPELLDYLAHELVAAKYDMRHIYRLILTSRTYQLSWRPAAGNVEDMENFSRRLPRRLEAEELLDAIGQVTQTSEPYTSTIPEPYTVLPEGFRAGQLFDGSINVNFLELFGRPTRDTAYLSGRNDQPSMRQAMHLLNSLHVESRLQRSPKLAELGKKKDADVVEELYLSTLSRPPGPDEKARALAYLDVNKKNRSQAIQDLFWAVFNTKEFLFNH